MIAVRPARPSDAEALTRLARAAKASWGYPAAWLDAWRDQLAIGEDYVRAHQVVVADEDGALAGMASLERAGGAAVLEHVWVAPDRQRRGVGDALVRHLLSRAAAAGDRVVRVTSDPQALGFYERLGGVVVASVAAPMPGAPDRALPVLELPADALS